MRRPLVASVVLAVACGHATHPHVAPPPPSATTLTIIGTNDLHGALERLPLLAGFIANVRAARATDGGGVLLVDAGDLFQGTLESNLGEGADVVRAYNAMGYAASAIGNHEFDYGPPGPAVTAKGNEDPRGALKARIAEARFPFLATNIVDAATGARIAWPNTKASTLVDVAGVKVGIIGASTASTPTTTMPANFAGLRISPAAQAIADEAKALRAHGAEVVVVTAHIGSECRDLDHPDDVASCDHTQELFKVLGDVPPGLVDVFVAGHTHAGVAHHIGGTAVIESFSSGRAFGRVDLRIAGGRVTNVTIHKPELLCPLDAHGNPAPVATCHPDAYEGKPVVADAAIQGIVDQALARAGQRRAEKLGVTLAAPITKAYKTESAEGDWFTDLMLEAEPTADVALANGGGLRADMPAGDLTYGELFAAMPFDNRFALVKVHGAQLRRIVASNLQRDGGILSWSGLTAKARCKDRKLDVELSVRGKPLDADATYTIATSDFLASGGDGLFGRLKLPDDAIQITDVIIREALADLLRKKTTTIDPRTLYGKGHARMDYEGERPVRCGGKQAASPEDSE